MLDFAINNDPTQAIATINDTIYYLYDGEAYSFNLSDNKNTWVSRIIKVIFIGIKKGNKKC